MPHLHQKNHDFSIMQQWKKKKYAFFPYLIKKYRVGEQQTNNYLRIALSI